MGGLDVQLASVGVLADAARRSLYTYVLAQPEPVSREQAASALGMPVHSAKFHLDKLVTTGLLDVEYRRLTGRSGPGAGRPAKLYLRSAREVALSVPCRRYDLAGEVLAETVDRAMRDSAPLGEVVSAVATEVGRRMAAEEQPSAAGDSRRLDDLAATSLVLARHGYEPDVVDGELLLSNCPFAKLAADHTELVCGLNVALVDGVLRGLGATGLTARLSPRPGRCCVTVGETRQQP